MNTISASKETWEEILEISNVKNGDHFAQILIDEFGENFFKKSPTQNQSRGSDLWYADQSLASYKIHKWLEK
uniref:Uncharacterized protein n=1 Tax=Acrobeloides nanus TaxID=290746 RepID=A0A914C895_9BILA